MGNKQEKECSKVNFEDCKKEYFKAVNKDMKESMKKINTTLNLEKNRNLDSDNWVDYIKQKLNEYCYSNKIENKQFQQIFYYLNNIGETNEAKHIYNLSIFLKKYFEGEVKIKQKNSNGSKNFLLFLKKKRFNLSFNIKLFTLSKKILQLKHLIIFFFK